MKKIEDKTKRLHIACFMIFISMFVIAGISRSTITNYMEQEDYTEHLQVAELPENFAISMSEEMKKELPKSNIIMKVYATGKQKYEFQNFQQEVKVEKIYKGNITLEQKTIWVMKPSWCVFADYDLEREKTFDGLYTELSFVNYMKPGKEYLLFLDQKVDTLAVKDKTDIYQFSEDVLITPIFCYEDQNNVVAPARKEFTYVRYAEVAENEFFSTTEKGISAMDNLKNVMINQYP